MPPVRAKFYAGANEVHSVEIPGKAGPLPARIDEGNLSLSANVLIPVSVLQPGLEMVIEIDPDETLGSALGTGRRIPAEGRTALDIRSMPNMELTVVPFLFASNPDSSILSIVRRMSENPKYSQLHRAHKVLPTNDWNVTAHEAVWTTRGTAEALLRQTRAIRWMEGGRGYWMGVMRPREGFTRGVAYRGGWTSFAEPSVWVIAHELGHNLSLGHAPCGLSDADSYYPHSDGAIGAWGIDLFILGPGRYRAVPPDTKDFMSYCGRPWWWISDYHFTNAFRHRLRAEVSSAPARTLLLWGGESESDGLFLETAFVVDAVPVLPDSAGGFTLTGRDSAGRRLFSVEFAMPEIADAGHEAGGFVYTLPVRPGWEALASVTLTAPDGRTAVLDGSTDRPMAILRDARTGQVRAFLDGPSTGIQADGGSAALAAKLGAIAITSRGIPDAAAWRR